ncbi:MAG: 2-succinyl-5-enolpyruvyl-6-hydroxy-3-cyclohexene-1-carboxylic-acid synthase [Muribaculaceae bacterium]|nr:2-succinyl-5-enolpyruvyl-6-hydroxy-3-cyclohexene-1-carboxylic-acid synthase [Muribaculaceae bacterium]
MRFTTTHKACNMLVDILLENNISNVVISPGSRNAPLIVAFSRNINVKTKVVVDERSAAFIALGMAQQLNQPVALVCTSGTAILNYAPAIAEAYYQHIPLIVISADRPIEWIDQDDGQTLVQNGILKNIVKKTYNIPSRYDDNNSLWYVNRLLNDAILESEKCISGPVHINFQLAEPLCDVEQTISDKTRSISYLTSASTLNQSDLDILRRNYTSKKKVLIVAGFYKYDKTLNDSICQLSKNSNTAVLVETITNISGANVIQNIDRLLTSLDKDQFADFRPDLLITFGGALVTRILKQKLRIYNASEHWHIGKSNCVVDTMQSLTKIIDVDATSFFRQLSEKLDYIGSSNYSEQWRLLSEKAKQSHIEYVNNAQWCDLKAFSLIFNAIKGKNISLQLSNGTTIRYAQLFGDIIACNSFSNRGVAGIDGATSTALGASLIDKGTTLLITGDMSFSYDLGALSTIYKNSNFKIIVLSNGGGGIFRFINGPSTLPELQEFFEVNRDINVKGNARAFEYDYFEANSELSFINVFDNFLMNDRCSILEIKTSNIVNAEILRGYFRRNRK